MIISGETIKVFLELCQSLSVIVGVYIAVQGINAWKREMIGKKKADLAEEVLAMAYEYQAILMHIRSPFSYIDEGKTREILPGEDESEQKYKHRFFVTIERANQHREFISKFRSHKYRFMAYFGKEAGSHIDRLDNVRFQAIESAKMLMDIYHEQHEYNTDPELKELKKKWKAEIGWGESGKDPFKLEIEEALINLESICRPCLMERVNGSKN